ncbi:hypothetical protein H2200_013574 [Cladophialophora chaetospira]|uniref:FAD-binding domain-containing protein n=1 Tax=Cladophialophora chaetospira TaxID=386627 RepID=A0AA38TYU0_9EURO|nr:hypothetical protein H2200_013574 [Cladophialophora chaetospira]
MVANASDLPVEQTQVLVIGASMVGMTLTALLAKHGVRDCIAVEKHSSTAIHPRAALFHPRTMQIYRELGLYDSMAQESTKHYDEYAGIFDVESLAGKFRRQWLANMNAGIESLSPVMRLYLTQQIFEPILLEKARTGGIDIRHSTELVSFCPDDAGVTALVRNRDTGQKSVIRAQYMIACDGSRSPIREALGIKMKGYGLMSHSLTIYFKADLGKYVIGKYNGVIYVNNPTLRGFFRLDKAGREGFLVVNMVGEKQHPADNITDERAAEFLKAAIGADASFEITLVAKWQARCEVAEKYLDESGRVILVGDSAHVVTPHGGFGGNTGIHDTHNLAWKLALVLSGKAGPALVTETYEKERLPVARKTVDQVFERYIKRVAPELREPYEKEGFVIEDEAEDAHLELGYRYWSRALDTDQKQSSETLENPKTATAKPGSMARHVFVQLMDSDDEEIPIADLLGESFVLILGSQASGWIQAAQFLQTEKQFPEVKIHQLKAGSEVEFCSRYGISSTGAVLIRPDGFVAWSESGPAVFGFGGMGIPDSAETLRCVLKKLLCLGDHIPSFIPQTAQGERLINRSEGLASITLSRALFTREQLLLEEKSRALKQIEEIERQLADVKRLSVLQDEMAMLSMKLLPVWSDATTNPPKHLFRIVA